MGMRTGAIVGLGIAAFVGAALADETTIRPNVVLVMTDDQGYGDIGCLGNPVLGTPSLDRLHGESIRLTDFHVDPTCAPTRAALLTGRYSARTGVWHTIMGRSILRADETTLADLFARAGYRTGIFGKWHLGDVWPYRAMDRGFQESLVHGGGGIGQTPDYWGNTYFDPTLCHNGRWEKASGYCTDVFFSSAIEFIRASGDRPFFCYLPTNVPHSPNRAPEAFTRPYRDRGLPESQAEFYGMIAQFDANLGALLAELDRLGIARDTIFVFLTDNGTAGQGFNVGMRGRKGAAYDGGHRVPCFIRWPARLRGGRDIDQLAAHIDLLPTLADWCGLTLPEGLRLDGRSLAPLLDGGDGMERTLPLRDGGGETERTLFVQSHRVEQPIPWRQSAVLTRQYRLVDGRELYDMAADPGQQHDVAGERPEVVRRLRAEYEKWYDDVSARFGETVAIPLGVPGQERVALTCHDWHDPQVPWNQSHVRQRMPASGYWAVEFVRAGLYRFTLREQPAEARFSMPATGARLAVGEQTVALTVPPGSTEIALECRVPAGSTRLQSWLTEGQESVRGA